MHLLQHKYLTFAVLAVMLIALAASPAFAATAGWTITQLTDNSYVDETPQISNSNVVWEGDNKIFYYNGSMATQMTNNDSSMPQISGSNAVWGDWDVSDYEILFHNGSTTTQLTNNNGFDIFPQISGSNIVWQIHDGNDYEIYFYDGSTTVQLTNNNYHDEAPQISGSNIVWQGSDDGDSEIFLYNGSTTTQLTNNGYDDLYPQISGSNIVWCGGDGNGREIFFYNGSTITQLTNNSYVDDDPQISGTNVVWRCYDGNDAEIFFYNGAVSVQLTNNSYDDRLPQISGENIVWESNNGVFVYNDSTIIQLSNNYNDCAPQISGSNVVWQGWDGSDFEIFMATPAVPVKFGSYDGLKNIKVTLKDSDGNDVTFSLTGGGYGQIDPCDPNFSSIRLYDTTERSTLLITTRGRGVETSVCDIIAGGSLGRIIAKTADLRGNINIAGSLGMLMMDDAVDANTITIGASANPRARVNMYFDQISDLHIDSNMPIGILRACEWLDTDEIADEVNAPCLSSLLINGDRRRSITGDFEAGIVLDSNFARGVSLVNAKIAGDLTGGDWNISGNATTVRVYGTLINDVNIHGNVNSMYVNMLHGNVIIDCNARSVKVGEPLTVSVPESGQIGYLHIGGSATVRSGRDNIKFINCDLYTSDPNMYRLEDLRRYDVLGAVWDYNCTYNVSGSGIREIGIEQISVSIADTLSNLNGHECSVVNVSSGVDGNSSTLWYTDEAGTHLAAWIIDDGTERIDLQVDSPLIAPSFLQMGQKYIDAAPFTGQWETDVDGEYLSGSIDGQATTTCRLVGHQQITVPVGTYLAAKVEDTVAMNGQMELEYEGYNFYGRFSATIRQTWWGVPDVGVVKSISSMTIRMSISGVGSLSVTGRETNVLTGYSD